MKYGIREICDVVFKAKADMKIGNKVFHKGRPVLYIDSAKTSTIEGAATTVYAQGGRGNSRLIAWEGEKTLTFTVEDALLSPISFSMLSGAGVIQKEERSEKLVHTHQTIKVVAETSGTGDDVRLVFTNLTDTQMSVYYQRAYPSNYDELSDEDKAYADKFRRKLSDVIHVCPTAPIFVYEIDDNGEVIPNKISAEFDIPETPYEDYKNSDAWKYSRLLLPSGVVGHTYLVDCYVLKTAKVTELQIDAEHFAGSFYVEASTLFREKSTGVDRPAEITFPNVKIQSNFTFSMASSGDPSTFTFTMDAMPGYTYFNKTKEVLCVIQIIEDESTSEKDLKSVMSHNEGTNQIVHGDETWTDSYPS